MTTFAITGVAGYIARRHLEAIRAVGGRVVAALDPHDSVGILDSYGLQTQFFTEYERFERHLEWLALSDASPDWMVVCSPNYLHDPHVRLGLRTGMNVICEKPLVVTPRNLGLMRTAERQSGGKVVTILQSRLHPRLREQKTKIDELTARMERGEINSIFEVQLTYITSRGLWYEQSWKGHEGKSGGIAMNIGVHLFDMLIWFFGLPLNSIVHLRTKDRIAGATRFKHAVVRWFLSTNGNDAPAGSPQLRELVIDKQPVDFTSGFDVLHAASYREIMAGNGFGIDVAEPSLNLVHEVRTCDLTESSVERHPFA